MNVLRPEIALWVDERLPTAGDLAIIADVRDPDLDHTVMMGRQDARGLEVDDGECHQAPASATIGFGAWRSGSPDMSRGNNRVTARTRT